MKSIYSKLVMSLVFLFIMGVTSAVAGNAVTITDPPNGAMVSSPVKVCLATEGVEVQPAKKGVNEGKGHHHIIVDVDLPKDLSKPIGKDANHIHMGDGSTCKEIKLSAGKHTIRGMAWSGEGSISKVEVSVNNGETWLPAQVGKTKSSYAWQKWEFVWEAGQAGHFLVRARATDKNGRIQPIRAYWNFRGFANNAIHAVPVTVK